MENWLDVFNDSDLNDTLKRDGIVKFNIPDFNAESYSQLLKDIVDGYPHEFESTFYGSVSIADLDIKRKVDTEIASLLTSKLTSSFVNHRLLTYFFLVKGKGDNSVLRLHQDWNIIDERKYRAYNLWIPLSDSSVKNGTLFAIKGSHNFPLNIRGAAIPPKYASQFETAKKYLTPFNVKTGEALLFDSSLLHYSPPNHSKNSRTAIINNVIPADAETMCFHGKEKDGQLEVNRYDVPDDLFIHYNDFNNQKDSPNPVGVHQETIDYGNTTDVSSLELKSLLKAHQIKKKSLFLKSGLS